MSTSVPKAVDVRPLPAARKSETVLAMFDRLDEGESFILVDDRDPASLRAYIESKRADAGQWGYIKQGPPVWHVRIERIHQARPQDA